MTYKSRSMPNDEKKIFFSKKIFTKYSWTRGKQLWQNCRLFFDEKKTVISPFTFQKSLKKQTKTLSKRSYILKLILRTRRKQCRQFSRKKIWTKTNNFWMNVRKWCEKKFLTKIFSQQSGLIDKQKAVLTTWPTHFRRNDRKNSLNAQCWNRKRTFSEKKFSAKNLIGHVESHFDNAADCFPKKALIVLFKVRKW